MDNSLLDLLYHISQLNSDIENIKELRQTLSNFLTHISKYHSHLPSSHPTPSPQLSPSLLKLKPLYSSLLEFTHSKLHKLSLSPPPSPIICPPSPYLQSLLLSLITTLETNRSLTIFESFTTHMKPIGGSWLSFEEPKEESKESLDEYVENLRKQGVVGKGFEVNVYEGEMEGPVMVVVVKGEMDMKVLVRLERSEEKALAVCVWGVKETGKWGRRMLPESKSKYEIFRKLTWEVQEEMEKVNGEGRDAVKRLLAYLVRLKQREFLKYDMWYE